MYSVMQGGGASSSANNSGSAKPLWYQIKLDGVERELRFAFDRVLL